MTLRVKVRSNRRISEAEGKWWLADEDISRGVTECFSRSSWP